ncbi:uncharacterized protein BYT42DRAFT_555709 [Radiomyces spectabilis]|uniref:uncharacterized protein n=1 Tax=Radiomyces spectabilis TaxID=64574 RepID=UPI0022205B0D|nr:uncharacterized protein BYT42DRAFT_555709 [Radiomyces spectabilis]KAI8391125.1 hypothetical protein BYT42DRAFT_555709 [Radiomyces spectabilis]
MPLLNKFVSGYNSTILAYGQTGSGKTYSMGIGLETIAEEGIVPRFIYGLFDKIQQLTSSTHTFQVAVSFVELYHEDLIDLLSPNRKEGVNLSIREDCQGNICWMGVREELVQNPDELFGLLQKGSIARTTASTDMNRTSSRSHAIFSVILKQTVQEAEHNVDDGSNVDPTIVSPVISNIMSDNKVPASDATIITRQITSKFHFVDLAGSERLKRTNAVGDRAKEGISINSGLLALGNVISALGDPSRRVSHIPYRDSKLTRLLQDSLGGNSQTLMLACLSPAVINFPETLNTLKYANRARNIRNRVVVNQDTGESNRLKALIVRLKDEIRTNDEFLRAVNDEMDSLKREVQSLTQLSRALADELARTKKERDLLRTEVSAEAISKVNCSLEENGKTEQLHLDLLSAQCSSSKIAHDTHLAPSQVLPIPHSSGYSTGAASGLSEDDSATLVGSLSKDSMLKSMEQLMESPERSRKKRRSYRFGSKRSVRGRRRHSFTSQDAPKASTGRDKATGAGNFLVKQAKADIRDDLGFLVKFKEMQQQKDTDIYSFTDTLQADLKLSIPVSVPQPNRRYSALRSSSAPHNNLVHKLMARYSAGIEKRQQLIVQLEQESKERKEIEQQLAALTAKHTKAITQHQRAVSELSQQHENKCRKQLIEIQTLRRKHSQLVHNSATTRSKNEATISSLKQKLEEARHEKKRLIKRIKQESDRARDRCGDHERELQRLRQSETKTMNARKRHERELAHHKQAAKRASEESMNLNTQLKQVALMLKKAMAQKQVDRALVAKALSCTAAKGHFTKQNSQRRSNKTEEPKIKQLHERIHDRKNLLRRAIALHTTWQIPVKIIQELEQKCQRLKTEQEELLAERQAVLTEEAQHMDSDVVVNASAPQYMDERIDMITAQVDFLKYQLDQLQAQQLEDNDDDSWVEVVDPSTTNQGYNEAQAAYEIASFIIQSLEPDEMQAVAKFLLEELVESRAEEQTCRTLLKQVDQSLHRFQQTLVKMRRLAREHGMAGMSQESCDQFTTMLDSVHSQAMQGRVHYLNGLVLLYSNANVICTTEAPLSAREMMIETIDSEAGQEQNVTTNSSFTLRSSLSVPCGLTISDNCSLSEIDPMRAASPQGTEGFMCF